MSYICIFFLALHTEAMTNLIINELSTVSGFQKPFPRPTWKMVDYRSGIGNVQDGLGLYCDTR